MTNLQRLIKLVEGNRVREALTGILLLEVPDKLKHLSNYGGELISAMVKCNVEPNVIIDVCFQWQSKGINKFGLSQATEAAIKHLPYDQAKNYLDQLVKRSDFTRPHLYAPLICKTSNVSRISSLLKNELKLMSPLHPESIFELFADSIWPKLDSHYEEFFARCIVVGLTPNFLLNTCIAHCLSISDVVRLDQLLSSNNYNLRFDYKLVPYLVRFLLSNEMEKSSQIVRKIGSSSFNQTVFNSLMLINAIGVLTDTHDGDTKLEAILKMMRKNSLFITPVAGDLLEYAYDGSHLQPLISKLVDHRTQFNSEHNALYFYSSASYSPVEIYENHLKLLESTSSTKIRGIVRKLILTYCSGNNQPTNDPNPLLNQRINQLLEKLKKTGDSITPAMASVLMSFFAINDDLDKALYYKSMIPDSFIIDLSKLLNLAIKMAENGQIDGSIDMVLGEIFKLDHVKKPIKSFASYTNDTLVRDYLETIGKLTIDVKTIKTLSDSFLTTGLVNPNNKTLRPRVTVHLYCDDLPGALEEFSNCIKKYKKTPGKNNLIIYLIEKQLFDQIDNVIKLVGQFFNTDETIFGCVNDLIISGYPDIARELIIRMKYNNNVDKQSIRALIVHNLAKERIDICLSLIQFYRNNFNLDERKHFYKRIYSLSSINKDSISLNKILTLMKDEKIDPNDDDDVEDDEFDSKRQN